MVDEKVQNIKQALADYFNINVEEVHTFIIGMDHRPADSDSMSFSTVYHGLTTNWAIGNLEGIKHHIEQEKNRAAMNMALSGLTEDNANNGEV